MRNDPFRTLDDPEPAPAREAIAEPVETLPAAAVLLGWVAPLQRPGWLRRLVVWLLLGWKWE